MVNRIQAEHDASTVMAITLASLASSVVGVGRQSTLINNVDDAQLVHVFFLITTGTSPTADRTISFYLIKGDDPASSNIRTDGAGASDAGLTVETADLVYAVATDATSNKGYRGSFLLVNPGPEWGIAVVHDTAVVLNSTGGNHILRFVDENQEVQ